MLSQIIVLRKIYKLSPKLSRLYLSVRNFCSSDGANVMV